MARNPIVFQNGTLVSNAKVEVGGTVYDVTPAQYEGTTPLSANNLNQMQTNIYDYVDEEIDGIIDEYSTSEQLVGKWHNGDDLYRIVFEKTGNFSNTTVALGTLNTNYRMRLAIATFYNSSNDNEYLMSNSTSAITHIDNNINVVTTAAWGNGTVEAIVYYTK